MTARMMSESPPMCPGDRHRPQRSPGPNARRFATAEAEAAKVSWVKPSALGGPEEPEVRMKAMTSGEAEDGMAAGEG